MANLPNAKKAIRSQARKAEINKMHKIRVKRLSKETRKLAESSDTESAMKKFSEAVKAIDKAAKRYLHKKTAARLKSRLAKSISA